jgi:hypothetical protein
VEYTVVGVLCAITLGYLALLGFSRPRKAGWILITVGLPLLLLAVSGMLAVGAPISDWATVVPFLAALPFGGLLFLVSESPPQAGERAG